MRKRHLVYIRRFSVPQGPLKRHVDVWCIWLFHDIDLIEGTLGINFDIHCCQGLLFTEWDEDNIEEHYPLPVTMGISVFLPVNQYCKHLCEFLPASWNEANIGIPETLRGNRRVPFRSRATQWLCDGVLRMWNHSETGPSLPLISARRGCVEMDLRQCKSASSFLRGQCFLGAGPSYVESDPLGSTPIFAND